MDMGGSSSGSDMMMASDMAMVFFNSRSTPLYSLGWIPSTTGGYAGTCIFLITLSIIFRSLLVLRNFLEIRWADQAWKRRYITVVESPSFSEGLKADPTARRGVLTANGVEENVAIVQRAGHGPQPWRATVDFPRAFLAMVIAGVGYLLMLAVMTLNVGYYLSILAGVFVGELAVGRFHHILEEHH
jgi:solute carrier family 31 (copper transporter), member 1